MRIPRTGLALLLLLSTILASCASSDISNASSADATLTANLSKIVDGWNRQDPSVFETLIATDFVRTSQGRPHFEGRAGFEKLMRAVHSSFPGHKVTLDSTTVHGNQVFTRWTVNGTHGGEFFGSAGTGTAVDIRGFSVWTFDGNGILTKEDSYWDDLATLKAIGFSVRPPDK